MGGVGGFGVFFVCVGRGDGSGRDLFGRGKAIVREGE